MTYTKDKAIEAATAWWLQQMRSGAWDNGDAETEAQHRAFAAHTDPPTDDEWRLIEESILSAVTKALEENHRGELYSDYGCPEIDAELNARGLRFSTLRLGPQKAGTMIEREEPETYRVWTKAGYGAPWTELKAPQ